MERAILDGVYNGIIAASADRIAQFGFRRRRAALRILRGSNSGVIEFQKSMSSTREKIRFTVNLAVVCEALLDSYEPPLTTAGSVHGHLQERIGQLMPAACGSLVGHHGSDGRDSTDLGSLRPDRHQGGSVRHAVPRHRCADRTVGVRPVSGADGEAARRIFG